MECKRLKILYINYVDCTQLLSGSSVRPAKILKAFEEEGHEVILLSGEQVAKDRKKKIKAVLRKIKIEKPDICYIESPTYPIMRHADRKLIKTIHRLGVPIGYFYRDFYRRFPEQFPRRTSFTGRLKEKILDILQYLTDRVLRYCDVVYFPTEKAGEMFSYKNKKSLPPAGENRLQDKEINHTGIYVGGIIGPYNGELLLDTFENLHRQDATYKLILVCREAEWKELNYHQKNAEWLTVYHVSGEQLRDLYGQASFAMVMPKQSLSYNHFAMSVKIFEYLSYGLPLIALNCEALAEFCKKEKIGIVVDSNKLDLVNAIKTMTNKEEVYKEYCESVRKALLERHLWKHRVQTIVQDLRNCNS